MRMVYGICALLLSAAPVSARYEYLNDPALESKMARDMLYPTVLLRTDESVGAGTAAFSRYVDNAMLCRLEPPLGATAETSCTGTEQGKEIRSYVISSWHVVEDLFEIPPIPLRKSSEPDAEITTPRVQITIRVAGTNSAEMEATFAHQTARIVAADKKSDLVLLRLENVSELLPQTANIAPRDVALQPFRTVWALGTPLSLSPLPTDGLLGGIRKFSARPHMLSTAPVYGGNSGGGLYHWSPERDHFELIAVVRALLTSRYGPIPHLALSVPIQSIHDFLESNGYGFIAQ